MSHQAIPLGGTPRVLALLALTLCVATPGPGARAGEPAAPAGSGSSARAERKVRLDFVGADVAVVTKALSIQSGENIVLMPSVSGKVTIRLTDTTLEDALKKVAAAVGADVRRVENSYFIGSTVELRAMMSRSGVKTTYAPKHLQAADVKELVQAAYPYLTVETVGKTNLLVMSGAAEDVKAALARVETLDVPPPAEPAPPPQAPPPPVRVRDAYAVKFARAENLAGTLARALPELKIEHTDNAILIEGTAEQQTQAKNILAALDVQANEERLVRAYRLKYGHPVQTAQTLRKLFPNLTIEPGLDIVAPPKATLDTISQDAQKAFNTQNTQTNQSAMDQDATAQLNREPGARARVLLLAGAADEVEQASRLLDTLDVAPRQVLIEARLVEISPDRLKQLGLEYQWSDLTFQESAPHGAGRSRGPLEFGPWRRLPFDFSVTLNALETNRTAKILARPNISVIDGEEASVFIGDIVRFERLSSVTDNGQQIFTIESIPIGVALLVRPRVNDDGNITLRVHPVVSMVTGFTGNRQDLPITSSREASSTVVLRDGETIVIGGLLREDDIRTMRKIPLLGDIPILGELFRNRETRRSKTEITVFITVRLQKG